MSRRFPITLAATLVFALLAGCEGDQAGNPFAEATVTTAPSTSTSSTTILPATATTSATTTTAPPQTTTTAAPTTTTTAPPAATGWSDAVQAEYLAGCVEDAPPAACLCTLEALEETYSESEFIALAEIWDEIELPQGVIDAIESCGGSVDAEPIVLWTDNATVVPLTAAAAEFEAAGGVPVEVVGFDYPSGALYDADVGLDTDGAIESFTEFDNLVRQGYIRWDDEVDPTIELIEGRTAFAVVDAPEIEPAFVATPLPYAVSPLPSFDEDSPAIGLSLAMGLMLNAASEQPEVAREFLRSLVRGEPMRDIAATLGFGSVHGDSFDQIVDIDQTMASLAGVFTQPIPPIGSGTLWILPLVEAGEQIYRQTNGPIQVLREAAAQVREAIAGG